MKKLAPWMGIVFIFVFLFVVSHVFTDRRQKTGPDFLQHIVGAATFSPNAPSAPSAALSVLPSNRPVLRALERISEAPSVQKLLASPHIHSLKVFEEVRSRGVQTIKFQHYYKEIEVIGSTAFYHFGPAGEQVQIHLANVDLNVKPAISSQKALLVARSSAGESGLAKTPELKILPATDLKSSQLIYRVKIAASAENPSHEVWINAHSGKIISDIVRQGFFE